MCSVVLLFGLKTEECSQPSGLSRNLTQRNISESRRCSKNMNFLVNERLSLVSLIIHRRKLENTLIFLGNACYISAHVWLGYQLSGYLDLSSMRRITFSVILKFKGLIKVSWSDGSQHFSTLFHMQILFFLWILCLCPMPSRYQFGPFTRPPLAFHLAMFSYYRLK